MKSSDHTPIIAVGAATPPARGTVSGDFGRQDPWASASDGCNRPLWVDSAGSEPSKRTFDRFNRVERRLPKWTSHPQTEKRPTSALSTSGRSTMKA